MKKKLLMTLLAGSLVAAAPVSCFAAEAAGATETTADEAEDSKEEDSDDVEDSEEADEDENAASADKKKEELKSIGEKTDDCIAFKIKNATSKKITGLAIKGADETEFPENMMKADDFFDLKEKKKVFLPKETEETESETTEETSEEQAPTYDLHITFEDDTTADIHGVTLEDISSLTIREKDGIVYGTYKENSTKEKKSTYDTEKAIADQAAAEAQAAAAQQTESYTDSSADTSYDYSDTSNDYSYDYSDTSDDYTYDYGTDDGGADYSGGDGGDGCLDDGLLN